MADRVDVDAISSEASSADQIGAISIGHLWRQLHAEIALNAKDGQILRRGNAEIYT
jgi:hypothetical protein